MKSMILRIIVGFAENQRINIYKSSHIGNIMDPITVAIVTGISVSIISGIIIGFLNRRWKIKDAKKAQERKIKDAKKAQEKADYDEIKKQIELLRKAFWRSSKALIIMAKILDDQTEKSHPELNPALEEIVDELLKESNGA